MAVTDEDLAKLIVQFSADFTRYRNETQKIIRATYGAADKVERRFNSMERRVSRTGDNIGRQFRMAIAALGTGFAVRDLGRLADAWTEQENALKSVAAAVNAPVSSMQQLAQVALDTRSAMAPTVTLYARTERAARQLGRSQAELRRFVELTNMAFVAGGATGTERRSAILQLAQGLASEQLMGEELRSIRENAPLVARAIADAMGVGIGALRDLGAEGKITSEIVLSAVLAAGESIESQFDATTATVGQSLENLRTRAAMYIAELDDATNASENLAGFIDYVSRNLDALAEAAIVAATAIGGVLAGRAVAAAIPAMIAFAAATTGASGALGRAMAMSIAASRAFGALRASLMFLVTNPVGLMITAIATAVGYLAIESQNAASRADRLNRALAILGEQTDEYGASTEAAAAAQHALMEARRLDNLEIVRRALIEQRRELERLERAYADAARRAETNVAAGEGTRGLSIEQREEMGAREAAAARREMEALEQQLQSSRQSVDMLTEGFEDLSEEAGRIADRTRDAVNVAELAARANQDLEDVLESVTDTLGDTGEAQRMLNEMQRTEAIDAATTAMQRQVDALQQIEAAIHAVRAAEMVSAGIGITDEISGGGGFFTLSSDARAEVDALETEAARYRRVIEVLQGYIDALNNGTNPGAASDARREREQRLRREADALRDLIETEREFARALRVAEGAMRGGQFDDYLSLLSDIGEAQAATADSLAALDAQRQRGLITEARYREEVERLNAAMASLREQTDALAAAADRHEAMKEIQEQADAQERLNRLVEAQIGHELTIAQLRGDETQLRSLEREVRIRERIAELTELGIQKAQARNQATREADEHDRAREYGEGRAAFSQGFSDTARAALSGDLKNLLDTAFGSAVDRAFQNLGGQIYDAIFDVPANLAKASAEGAAQGSAAAAPMATAVTTSGATAAATMAAAITTAGAAAGAAMAASITAASVVGGSGGGGLIGTAMQIAGFGGFFDKGGSLAPGQWGFVGETGMERVRALPNGGVRIEPVKLGAGGAAAQRPAVGASVINFRQTIDLTGANGDETIRNIADQAAQEGAIQAVQAMEKRQGIRIRMQGG